MRALPPRLAAEWLTSKVDASVQYLMQPLAFEAYLVLIQRNVVPAEEGQPQTVDMVREAAMQQDVLRATLRGIRGLKECHNPDGTRRSKQTDFVLEYEDVPIPLYSGQTIAMVKAECLARIPFFLLTEMRRAAQEINELIPTEQESARFTQSSSRRASSATGTKKTASTGAKKVRRR